MSNISENFAFTLTYFPAGIKLLIPYYYILHTGIFVQFGQV